MSFGMSLSNWVVMSVFLLGLLSNANAQTVNSRSEEGNTLPSTASVEITTWQDNKRGACSFTFDDNLSTQLSHFAPKFKDLGFVGHPGDSAREMLDADDMFDFVTDLLDDFDKNETILKLFLEERPQRPFPPPAEWEMRFRDPTLMPFPKTMEIADACITNSSSVWLNKHFYL